jgi:hypothetical protein
MATPGTIACGKYLYGSETDGPTISSGVISTFTLKRPMSDGSLKEVNLNESSIGAPSESYERAVNSFKTVESLLAQEGFSFDDDGSHGLGEEYLKVVGDELIFASRQGFGSAITPQDEVYVYNAKTQVLRGLRNIPTKGMFQAAIMGGVTPDMLAEAAIAYNGDEHDWRYTRSLSPPVFHRLSDHVPFVTYSWLTPAQNDPTITVLFDSAQAGDSLSKSQPKQRMMGNKVAYPNFYMDITHAGDEITAEAKVYDYWIEDEDALVKAENEGVKLNIDNEKLTFQFDDMFCEVPLDPKAEMADMSEAIKIAMTQVSNYAGKTVLKDEW